MRLLVGVARLLAGRSAIHEWSVQWESAPADLQHLYQSVLDCEQAGIRIILTMVNFYHNMGGIQW